MTRRIFPGDHPAGCGDLARCPITDRLRARVEELSRPRPGIPVIHLIPADEWWVATFWAPAEAPWSVTFDIATPPRLVGSVWTHEDLELDVLMDGSNGNVLTEDEDEFVAAIDTGIIEAREAAAARRAADAIVELLSDPAATFCRAGANRLAEALGRGLPPITQLP